MTVTVKRNPKIRWLRYWTVKTGAGPSCAPKNGLLVLTAGLHLTRLEAIRYYVDRRGDTTWKKLRVRGYRAVQVEAVWTEVKRP